MSDIPARHAVPSCPLCGVDDPHVVVQVASLPKLRVVRVLDAPDYPAYYRVIWSEHVAELSDLSFDDRVLCMEAVVAVEKQLRSHLQPAKINVASLGNMVPHLHWHLVARHSADAHFPQAIWANRQRDVPAGRLFAFDWLKLDEDVRQAVSALGSTGAR